MRIVFYLESLRKPLRLAKGTDAVGGYGGSFSGPGDEKSLLSFLQKAAGCAGRQFAFAAWLRSAACERKTSREMSRLVSGTDAVGGYSEVGEYPGD